MEKYQTAGSLVIRRMSRLDLFALCVQGQRNGQRWNFFTFQKRLRIVNEGRIFSNEKLVYLKEKYGVIWGTVSSRVVEKLLSVELLDGFVLCIQGQRQTSNSKFQASWKRLRIVNKGRTFSYEYFLDFEEKYGKISDCRTFNYFKFSHLIHCRNVSDTDSLRYNSYLLLCMDNNLDHSFERKLLSTGRKLQLTLGSI